MKNYAGIGARAIAALIDHVILSFIVVGIGLALNTFSPLIDANYNPNLAGILLCSLFSIMASFAYAIAPIANSGATLGKRLMKIRVVDARGQSLGMGRALMREALGKWVSNLAMGIGFLWALWDADKQTWHDKIAGSYVVEG